VLGSICWSLIPIRYTSVSLCSLGIFVFLFESWCKLRLGTTRSITKFIIFHPLHHHLSPDCTNIVPRNVYHTSVWYPHSIGSHPPSLSPIVEQMYVQ
jgi:hypothetical protein